MRQHIVHQISHQVWQRLLRQNKVDILH
jgi:hypothetical protein